ncbi:hypothetical protein T230_14120 [Tannerella sp. oral taxon BU063 isolate Cell 1/3]|jgi:hypothetical protein|uniref:Methionyl-tRNA formyltransferase n=3 Tax=Tannerella serpentiformis TaxID=712710 RepID=W2CFZ2_9BACT|nr:hypothetical protein N425_02120 [Tannerella sp. oral taxon BU063 isolate Cell 2]ETK06134.1 hypothetical protein T230_14120 [Tannerella sp. oral taxon BU063 isolate Cell 1/3]ETK13023.1 hypothetical protein T235_05955 [Tannerella sp. oral taxon BU063 isolate Cell 8/11]
MKYNTAEKHLAQPEYGRNVQNLVDYCVTIEDREERNRCANAIISIMGNLYPQQRDTNDFKHILWDHLAIMSGFKLDVDYPYEVVKEADLQTRPPRIPYVSTRIRSRQYGKIMEQMVGKATEMENSEAKDYLVRSLANQMKRSYVTWNNKDTVSDAKIFKDLAQLSDGLIDLKEGDLKLIDGRELQQVAAAAQHQNKSKKFRKKK